MNPQPIDYLAIDVSKAKLHVQTERKSFVLANSPAGVSELIGIARGLSNPVVVFEATGGYERLLRSSLGESRVPFHMVNPRRLRGFAISEGIQAKTDPIDAALILSFARQKQIQPVPPPSEENIRMAELMDRRSHLSEQLTREKNRSQKAVPEIREMIEEMIVFIEKQITMIDEAIRKLIGDYQRMNSLSVAMQTVCGVGEITAWTILAYLPEIGRVGRNQICALVGVAPFNRDSGTKEGRRFIQGGRAKIRRCLFLAARTAATHNPVIRDYVTHLTQEKGKHYNMALTAAMRKLIIHLQSIVKNAELELA